MGSLHSQRTHCRREMTGALQVELTLSGTSFCRGTVVDFTPNGIGVSTELRQVEIGHPVEIAVENKGARQVIHGYLRHYTKGRAGIEFDAPAQEVIEQIGGMVFTDATSLIDLAIRRADKKGLSLDALADEVQVSRVMLGALARGESGISRLTPDNLRRLAAIAGVSVIEAYLAAGLLLPQDVWTATRH